MDSNRNVPRFSILTPVYNPPAAALEAMLRSVASQSYESWEHCLVDDASTEAHVPEILERAAQADPRVRVVRRQENGGIVAASSDALAMAQGEFVVLLDNDDELAPEALEEVDAAIQATPTADYLYSDEDKIDEAGQHTEQFFKPDWSPERMRVQMYTGHLSVLRHSLVEEVGGFRAGYEGSQDWDLVLRVTERAQDVVHVPKVLYHWRMLPGSTAAAVATEVKPYAIDAGVRAVQAHCDRIGLQATVVPDDHFSNVLHLRPNLQRHPKVSIVIPTAGTRRKVRGEEITLVTRCVSSIMSSSSYPDVEILCVTDQPTPAAVLDELREIGGARLRIVPYDKPFNYSEKINLGAAMSRGEHLLMLNDDMEIISIDFIERMVMYSQLPGMGAVGAKLYFEDGRIQHAGVVFSPTGPGHVFRGFSRGFPGYFANAFLAANFTAVTGACVMSPSKVFEQVGGLSVHFPVNFNDMDYCLKLRRLGYRVMVDPDTQLYHFESSTRSAEVRDWEYYLLRDRWLRTFDRDPYYNPGLLPGSVDFVPSLFSSDGTLVV